MKQTTTENPSQSIRIRLVLEVDYALNGLPANALASRLERMVEAAMGDGLLTGDTSAEVEQHSMVVRVLGATLSEHQLAAFMRERIENGELSLEDVPSRLARYGLMDPHEFAQEMRERMDNAASDFDQIDEPIAPGLMLPCVTAKATADDTGLCESFDAVGWFAQASDQEIRELHAINWGGNYAADAVAEYFEASNEILRRIVNGTGFECEIDGDEAMAWLKQHKIGLWASLLCDSNDVSVVPISGIWKWAHATGTCADNGFSSVEAACCDAVTTLQLCES